MGPDIVDIKPANMEDLTEVITASEFHPHHCNLFVYSSSKGSLRLCDMRAAALCDKHSKRKCPFHPGTRWAVGAAVLCPGRVGTVRAGGPWAPCCCRAAGRGSLVLPPPPCPPSPCTGWGCPASRDRAAETRAGERARSQKLRWDPAQLAPPLGSLR